MGGLLGKKISPLLAKVCGAGETQGLLFFISGQQCGLQRRQGQVRLLFNDAGNVRRRGGGRQDIWSHRWVRFDFFKWICDFLRDSPVQAATKCGRRPTTSTATVNSQEFIRRINLALTTFLEENHFAIQFFNILFLLYSTLSLDTFPYLCCKYESMLSRV